MMKSKEISIREATIDDVDEIMSIRLSVKENVLSNPELVTSADCIKFLTKRGRGWVAENAGQVLGFAIVDLLEDNVWALFLRPEYESVGLGKRLHQAMLSWYFDQDKSRIWLSTEPNTRAEGFYRRQGWTEIGTRSNGEIKFEMVKSSWNTRLA